MALYHLSAKIIGRKAGQSSVACAAYRSGEVLKDNRTGQTFRFRRAERVVHTEILAPCDVPAWALNRADLWNEVETRERRKDAQLAREFELALPRSLSLDQQRDLLRGWISGEIVQAGAVADIAIHYDRENHNPHAHVMTTMRALSSSGWDPQKLRAWEDRSVLEHWRASWAQHTNAALMQAGIDERVDHRSYERQGKLEEPQIKEGPAARAIEARGDLSALMEMNRQIRDRNAHRKKLLKRALLSQRHPTLPSIGPNYAFEQRAAQEPRKSTFISPTLSAYGLTERDEGLKDCVCVTCPLSQWQAVSGKLICLCSHTTLQTFSEDEREKEETNFCDVRENFLSGTQQ